MYLIGHLSHCQPFYTFVFVDVLIQSAGAISGSLGTRTRRNGFRANSPLVHQNHLGLSAHLRVDADWEYECVVLAV